MLNFKAIWYEIENLLTFVLIEELLYFVKYEAHIQN